MIQRTNHNGVKAENLQTVQGAGKTLAQHVEKLNHENKNDRLNIYEAHLKGTSATYSEEIKQAMQKEKIEDNNLNANIIKTMNKSGVDITKGVVKTIVNQLQEEHLFKLFQDGYDIETLTVDIIAKEIIQSETAPISQDKTAL